MRMVWLGEYGYATTEIRDDTFAAFAAQAGQHLDVLTPSTWDAFPDVPAGLTSGITVEGLPGFCWCYQVDPPEWANSEAWALMADMAGQPSEGGSQQISQIPD